MAARLDDVLATLAGRIHGVPDRQATLAATLNWSHDRLAEDERAVFRRLSVFAGGFALDAAEEVCSGGLSEPVAMVVSRLVDKSLVSVETSGDRARFRLLEVIRQYAAGCLASSGSWPATSAGTPSGTPTMRSLLTLTLAVASWVSRAHGSPSKAGTCGQHWRRHWVRCQTALS